jgi:hypothetical protein
MHGPHSKGAGVCGTNAPETHNNEHPHFANDDGNGKALATMKARAALCGCTLIEMADGEFLVARWNYSRAVPCLRAVGDLLRQIDGGRP